MSKLKICMVANHACVRVDKMALPLLEKGYNVHIISERDPNYYRQYTTRTKYDDLGQLIESVKIYSKIVDLFHVHNEPSWYVTAIKEHCDTPVVLDVHDSFLARSTPEEATKLLDEGKYHVRVVTEERNNFQLADGLVFPGQSFGGAICSEFKLTQPRLTLPSYCTKRMQVYNSQEWLGGLVYEGRIDLEKDTKKHPQGHGFRYCDYEKFAVKCKELGIDFHIYSRNDKPFLDIYEKMSLTHVPAPFNKLIGQLSRHDWGLVGNLDSTPEWDVAFPNKMFEYISAGVPVVAINAHECGKFLTDNGLGIEVESLEELTHRWSEHTEIRKNILKNRQKWVMESHIADLELLYEEVLNG